MNLSIRGGRPEESDQIARLIMEAMSAECCLNLAGPGHSLHDFHRLMTRLVAATDSQYSYRNTFVAEGIDHAIMGICVCYDGGELHRLRQAFIKGAQEAFGMDHSGIRDETGAGEFYVDSLCVARDYRHQGVASALLKAAVKEARKRGIGTVGLLVDEGNPGAERLYRCLGFQDAGASAWAGHPMKHLVYRLP